MKASSNLITPTSSIEDNLHQLQEMYPITSEGKWGVPSKRRGSKRVRLIYSDDQYKAADHFWSIISQGGFLKKMAIGKGDFLLKASFPDGSYATYRVSTSSANSPAIEYRIRESPLIKIHFEKKGVKE